jgi:hypothetical protein
MKDFTEEASAHRLVVDRERSPRLRRFRVWSDHDRALTSRR